MPVPEIIRTCDEIPEQYASFRALCVEHEDYRLAWMAGCGPGQDRAAAVPAEPKPSGGCRGKRGLAAQAWNLSKSLAAFAADGFRTVAPADYATRLQVCDRCELRDGNRCGVCGCFIAVKAKARAWHCPKNRWPGDPKPARSRRPPIEWVSWSTLQRDVLSLIGRLPTDLSAVCGVPRSGLLPATMIATTLHLPLFAVSRLGVSQVGAGYRMESDRPAGTHALLVDDSAYKGVAIRRLGPIVQSQWPEAKLTRAAVYATPECQGLLDVYGRVLDPPHLFEWHFFNSPLVRRAAFDFDGVLCGDIHPHDDDDGPRYLEAIRAAEPKYLARHTPLPLIVTARLEKYREQTEEWLTRHGVRVDRLIMGPWRDNHHRRGHVPAFKAEHFQRSRLSWFIESDPRQCAEIAGLSRRRVICPTNGKVY